MRFMILIHSSQASERAIDAEARDAFREAHEGVISDLAASGGLVDTSELPVRGAKIVSTRCGVSIVDGPSCRGSEWVSGYYIVDVVDEKCALDIAARFVEARYATVEMRHLS